MLDLTAKKTAVQALVVNAKTLHAELERKRAAGESVDPLDVQKLETMIADGQTKRRELTALEDLNALDGEFNEPGDRKTTDSKPGDGASAQPFKGFKSPGQQFIESKAFKSLVSGDTSKVKLALKSLSTKTILGETALSGGETIRADRQTEIIDIARQQPLSILNLVNHSRTTLNSVDYVRFTGRTDNADVVPEGDPKPEGDLAFDVVTASVKVVAEFIKASRQILDDAPNLRNLIDTELEYVVNLKLERLVVADMIANAGQSRVHQVSGRGFLADDTIADTIRRGITDIRLSFYEANGIIVHPTQGEAMELDKAGDGHYTMVYDPVSQRVWRVPVVETPAMTSGTALVGNFKLGYKVWDRQDAAVVLGYENDDFTRNLVTLLGELRAAYGTVRPLAIEKATGM